MAPIQPPRACPSCQSANLTPGKTGTYRTTFLPRGKWSFMGYLTEAFVCLDCGFLGVYLGENELKALRERVR